MAAFRSDQGNSGGSLIGSEARLFPVRNLKGDPISVPAIRGHVAVLNLWASWCTPCRVEMPDLERLYRRHRAQGMLVEGIDQGESRETASRFARQLGVTFPLFADEEQRYGRAYAALGLPTTIVIGANGKIVKIIDGPIRFAELEPLLHARFGL